MNTLTTIIAGLLGLYLGYFLLRLTFIILRNLINGKKFHHSLMREFDHLRLSKMLAALGINKRAYIYQNNVNEIQQQMKNCSACKNTEECDEKLAAEDIDISSIGFCNNEEKLKDIIAAKIEDSKPA